jgi:hypothetical protein
METQGSALSLIKRRMSGGTAEEMKCFWKDERPGGRWPGCHMWRRENKEEEEEGEEMMAHSARRRAAAMAAAAVRGGGMGV